MSQDFQYTFQYDFVLDGIELYINRNTFGLKISKLKKSFKEPLTYENNFGDVIIFKLDFDTKHIKKQSDTWIITKLIGNIQILFPNQIGENYDIWKIETYFECIIYLLFFIFNISLPGSFEILRSKCTIEKILLVKKGDDNIYEIINKSQSGKEFDFYINEDFYNMWQQDIIKLDTMPLEDVINWTMKFNIWFNQLSNEDNRLESAIYGFYHLFLREGHNEADISIDKVLYSALTIESLYNAPREAIGSILFKRILLLVGDKIINKSKFRKAFYGFYDLRSQIIHGSYQIHNPIMFDNFADDPNGMGKIWTDIRNKNLMGMYALIILSFQTIIMKELTKVEFAETLS